MFLPIALNVDNKLCLIVGGGSIAAHKCRILLEHGAMVRAVSTSFSDDPVWSDPRIERVCESYRREQLSGAALCIAATSDRHVNHSAALHARELSIPALNVARPANATGSCRQLCVAAHSRFRSAPTAFFPRSPPTSRRIQPRFSATIYRVCAKRPATCAKRQRRIRRRNRTSIARAVCVSCGFLAAASAVLHCGNEDHRQGFSRWRGPRRHWPDYRERRLPARRQRGDSRCAGQQRTARHLL